MVQKPKPQPNPKPLTRAQKNKRDRKARERLSKGRSLAFEILDARDKISKIGLGEAQSTKKQKRQIEDGHKFIARAENDLRQLGFDVEETLEAAASYRNQLRVEANSPQPRTTAGVGVYRLGNQKRFWT